MLEHAILFAASFASVFLQAMQSRCVNAGNRVAIVVNGLLLGCVQPLVWRWTSVQGGALEIAIYAVGGVTAALCAVSVYDRLFPKACRP